MNAVALLVATAVLGVDYGWHRLPNGEWEYIIQVEPALVETLVQGQALVSQMPPELQGVRRFRVQVGDGEIPREQLPTTPIGGSVGGIPLPGALGGNTGIGGLSSPSSGVGAFSPANSRMNPNFAGQRGATVTPGPWPIGVDPRVMTQLRSYEWVSLEPVELLPLENDFLRQLGGPEPMPRDDRPWEQFGPQGPGAPSRWPNAGRNDVNPYASQFPDDRTAAGRSSTNPLIREWNRNRGGNSATNPWKLDQYGNRQASDLRDSNLLPRPDGDEPSDQELDRFDLNEHRSSGTWPATQGTGRGKTTGQLASRGTERGTIEDRDAARNGFNHSSAGVTHGTAANGQNAFLTTRHTRGAISAENVGPQVWWPLTMTVVLLFASLGGNLYLGWLALDFYRRYRDAAWELRTSDGPG
jgi:hypothetical protein